ncbi:ATP-binding cassette domain-containing protein [Aerococcus vaginalis]
MKSITLHQLKAQAGERLLFDINDLTISNEAKIGIIGDNGAGKTTLLKEICRQLVEQSYRFGYLSQLSNVKENRSEGQRVALTLKQLFEERMPLLLLDEPSQNLDIRHQEWLIKKIKSFGGQLLMVSHDQELLDATVNTIWELHDGKLTTYAGNYTEYTQQRRTVFKLAQNAYHQQQRQIRRLEQTVEQQRRQTNQATANQKLKKKNNSDFKSKSLDKVHHAKAQASHARALSNRLQRIDRLEKPKEKVAFNFYALDDTIATPHTLFHLQEGMLCRNQQQLFAYPSLKLVGNMHWLITGNNGVGKSTFLESLSKQQLKGYYAPELVIGYFRQDLSIDDDRQTLWQFISQHSPYAPYSIRTLMAQMGFNTADLTHVMSTLSGGERVKATLVRVLVSEVNVLLLDEPTNYLDLRAIEALEQFVNDYPKALVLVSHDQSFIEEMDGQRFNISEGQMYKYVAHANRTQEKDQQLLEDMRRIEALNDSPLSLEELQLELQKKND